MDQLSIKNFHKRTQYKVSWEKFSGKWTTTEQDSGWTSRDFITIIRVLADKSCLTSTEFTAGE